MKKSSSSASTNSSTSTSAVSNVSNFSFSDDFTLGSRTKSQQSSSLQGGYNRHDPLHTHTLMVMVRVVVGKSPSPIIIVPKERYVFSNFRFLVNESFSPSVSVDEAIRLAFHWNGPCPRGVKMSCVPFCGCSCIPRFTRCGHFTACPASFNFFKLLGVLWGSRK